MTPAADPGAAAQDLLAVADHWCTEATRLGVEYVQVFVEAAADLRFDCMVRDGAARTSGSTTNRRAGVGVLVRHRDSWWYGSAPLTEAATLADQMSTIAGLGRPHTPPAPAPLPFSHGPSPWPQALATGAAEQWCAAPEQVRVTLTQDFFQRWRAVADSRGIRQLTANLGSRQRCAAVVTGPGSTARAFTRLSSPAWTPQTPTSDLVASAGHLTRDAVARARALLPARPAGHRRTPVVLAPKVGAALLHELIGHALEADNHAKLAARPTGFGDTTVCKAPLRLVDDPTVPDGAGSTPVDDDGTPASATTLVDDGVIAGELTSMRAVYPDAEPSTGNGRREDYTKAALPRATNTVVLPGPDRPEDLCAVPREGLLYVASLSSAETVATRDEFCFSAGEAYYLTPAGERMPLRDVNLFGDTRETLRRLVGIADDVEGDNATCGKQGQQVLIGLHSPTMRFAELDWWC
ncbi:TldD/PmbA family protein [Catellatospora sp. NPDC049111]|uniref:TldD/PmbA family protein n=1 Tax=Catellatospora sp. NPDC049111 TaxID=3155271 RepID=UPI0033DE7E51